MQTRKIYPRPTAFNLWIVVFVATNGFSLCALAQTPPIKIEGPRQVEPGTLVRLSANTLANETPFWIVLEPADLDYEQTDNGRKLLFAAGCQTNVSIRVILLAQQVVDGRIVTRQTKQVITVRDSSKPENPEVDLPEDPDSPPDDPPGDKLPDDTSLRDSPAYASAMRAWPTVRTDAAKELSNLVAENFEEVARLCQSNQFENPVQIWQALSGRNRTSLQLETTAWEPVARVLQETFQAIAPRDVPAHAFHLRAVAEAIRFSYRNRRSTGFFLPPAQQRIQQ